MGSAVSCNKCTTANTGSVMNLSDALVLRMVEGYEAPATKKTGPVGEVDWIEKIKCLDDAHSSAYGLDLKGLEMHMSRLEKHFKATTNTVRCLSDDVRRCYELNSECSSKCAREVDAFIKCLDVLRLEKLKAMALEESINTEKQRNRRR